MDMEWIVATLGGLVRGGRTLDEACRHLAKIAPEDQVRAAREEFERRALRLKTLDVPRTMYGDKTRAGWYHGATEDDRYWPALRRRLEARGWRPDSLASLDAASTKVVALLEAPQTDTFDVRGLVLGYVQSGKTANYSAVIAKAADAGYRLFIVLSGMHNALRRQTQRRLAAELADENPDSWHLLTTSDSDFETPASKAAAFLTGRHDQKILCVVKKNAAPLRKLHEWLLGAGPVLATCPVLVIDDEADQASINTSRGDTRTAVNRQLLAILGALPKVAYVGYTATPFANLFVDPTVPEDLYPRDFIVDLPQPDRYFGPERIFGRESFDSDDEATFEGLDMLRDVPDEEVPLLRPVNSRDAVTFQPYLTPSLEDALDYFWMATAARGARGQRGEHSSMLVHTTLSAAVHDRFAPLIDERRRERYAALTRGDAALSEKLAAQWEKESHRVRVEGCDPVPFETLWPHLAEVVADTRVVVENSRSLQRLTYEEEGTTQIVVGGNILSRGLTLEGLVVSYFVRTSSAYDTLLQMGRWFGFRPGYEDLPRVWMTGELQDFYFDLATVEREIRLDVERYEQEDVTPLQFAVRVRLHPVLNITARAKMQSVIDRDLSYRAKSPQMLKYYHRDEAWLRHNLEAATALLRRLEGESVAHKAQENGMRHVLLDVGVEQIMTFLEEFRFHPDETDMLPGPIKDYIRDQNRRGRLFRWNVVVAGVTSRGDGKILKDFVPGMDVALVNRSRYERSTGPDTANIGFLVNNLDRIADLEVSPEARVATLNDVLALREASPYVDHGVLMLYVIDKDSRYEPRKREGRNHKPRTDLAAVADMAGVSILFPDFESDDVRDGVVGYVSVDLSRVPPSLEELEYEEETVP